MATGHWSEEQITMATSLWRDGKTAGEIAPIVGKTRNSVLGAMHRRGVEPGPRSRPTPQRRTPHAPRPSRSRPSTQATPPPRGGRSLIDLKAGQCKWPTHQRDGRWMFCAAGIEMERLPYCAKHNRISYREDNRH